ncbi:carbonic anhydrase [Rugamonas sp. CCM 8940]|uniref:carbonic anhydrase n=1 Tax=Rugamonas sp. CCM 8940 TaxID=2765359 RepID=UPI0018F789D8|nr:carbonic anhydrase family protein [Rugamonas sp. CCM 8940]MBJ7313233.1 carbonic anhydrase family protein [Rugamonas sp. CCM 8940]
MKQSIIPATLAICALAYAHPTLSADKPHDAKPAHWSYSGHGDPAHWSELQPDFASCKLGKEQSPIDIRDAAKAELPALGFSYAAGRAEVVNNGHTIQVNVGDGNSAKLGGADYKLLQFHFHTPSEEKVNGKAYPLVAHMVHKNAEGKLAVVAVLFSEGKENPLLKKVFAKMPRQADGKAELAEPLNPADLLPAAQGYYAFMGSLTTPPCSEGVRWQVLKQPLEISKDQLATFRKLYPMNARPVQALNGRSLQQSQ